MNRKEKIKICHLSSAHSNTDRRILEAECTSLAKAGYEVYFIGRGQSRIQNGVKVIGLTKTPNNRIERIFHTTRAVYKKALKLDCDIYHIHDPELLLWAIKLKKHGKKVIFDSHEFYVKQIPEKDYFPKPLMKILGKIYGMYEDYIIKQINGVIFPCTIEGKNPYFGKCRNTAIVNNTPIMSELYEKYDSSIEKYEKSICCIGALSHSRGITYLIKAAYLAGCTVYLGGRFFPDDYEKMLEKLPEYTCVKYMGYLDRSQVGQLLSKCMICVSNTLSIGQYNLCDNLPTKVCESMALSIPIIISDSPYVRKIMSQYQFGRIVDPMNIEDIANAISYILEHPDEARKMGEEGRRAVREKFNWNVDEEHLLTFYKDIINEN